MKQTTYSNVQQQNQEQSQSHPQPYILALDIGTSSVRALLYDATGCPLMPLLTWEDTRPRSAAAELRAQLDEDSIHTRTGGRIHASYWPAKLRWISTAQPEVFKQTAEWISFGEYLHRRLLGRSVCSLSMASGTGMLETRTRSWDAHLQDFLGVSEEQFPPLGDLHDKLTGMEPEFASRWPALRDIPWFPAIGDGAAANVGSGCANKENWPIN